MENPKQKAVEMVTKHFLIIGGVLSDVEVTFKETKKWKEAKLHSLYSVGEIIENSPFKDYGFKFDSIGSRLDASEYFWNEIKSEIEKL